MKSNRGEDRSLDELAISFRQPTQNERERHNEIHRRQVDPAVEILPARVAEEVETARELFRRYGASLGFSLCFQSFEDELASLPGKYAPPAGRLLVARVGGEPAGCVALRKLEEGICEMKRLYVSAEFRGHGIGRRLMKEIIAEARRIGYRRMRLDTVPALMAPAVAMYRARGFREIPPYVHNPVEGAIFLELEL